MGAASEVTPIDHHLVCLTIVLLIEFGCSRSSGGSPYCFRYSFGNVNFLSFLRLLSLLALVFGDAPNILNFLLSGILGEFALLGKSFDCLHRWSGLLGYVDDYISFDIFWEVQYLSHIFFF